MKKYLLLGVSLFSLLGCAEDPAVTAAKAELKEVKEGIDEYREHLSLVGDTHSYLVEALDPSGETIAQWEKSLEYCKGKNIVECDDLSRAMDELSLTISMRAQRILASAEQYLEGVQ